MKKRILVVTAVIFGICANQAVAQESCSALQQITKTPIPSGALASQVQLIKILNAAIDALDMNCDFAIQGLSQSQIAAQRASFVQALDAARHNCSQLSSGTRC